MNAKVMTRSAILSRLGNYAGSAATRGESAREDILELANGVPAASFLATVTAAISELRLGRVIPAADRVAIVAAWSATDRVGGKIKGNVIASTLGVVPSTVTADLKIVKAEAVKTEAGESGESGEETAPARLTATGTDARVKRLTSMLASLRKITADIGETDNASADEILLLEQISGAALKITADVI
jgi:hypothetical protein